VLSKAQKKDSNRSRVQGSAPPLTAEAASLIEKETPALRSHIREVQGSKIVGSPHKSKPCIVLQ